MKDEKVLGCVREVLDHVDNNNGLGSELKKLVKMFPDGPIQSWLADEADKIYRRR